MLIIIINKKNFPQHLSEKFIGDNSSIDYRYRFKKLKFIDYRYLPRLF